MDSKQRLACILLITRLWLFPHPCRSQLGPCRPPQPSDSSAEFQFQPSASIRRTADLSCDGKPCCRTPRPLRLLPLAIGALERRYDPESAAGDVAGDVGMQAVDIFAGFLAASQTCQAVCKRRLRNTLTNWHPILNISFLHKYHNIFHLLAHGFNSYMFVLFDYVVDFLAWILPFPP
jgi:hypothetical protein